MGHGFIYSFYTTTLPKSQQEFRAREPKAATEDRKTEGLETLDHPMTEGRPPERLTATLVSSLSPLA
jgi:hypothetical protein